jgi:uncharacterized protein (UPF0332 family)
MPYTKEEYIAYRIDRAWRTFNDAKLLAESQSWNSSINRLYYACFYAVLALFAKHEINSHTHSGVKTQLAHHFIKTGIIDKTQGMIYADLFDYRQKGDYGDFFDFEKESVITLFPQVELFIMKIETLTKQ